MARFLLTASLFLAILGTSTAQPPAYMPAPPVPAAPQVPSLNQQRQQFLSADLRACFPRLGTTFDIIRPADDRYNGFSYVLGVTDRWLIPQVAAPNNPFAGTDRLLAQGGYRRLNGFDLTVHPGKRKAVVYATVTPDGQVAEIKAAALQNADGTWSAKIGKLAVIRFPNLEALRGSQYGLGMAVYERDLPIPTAPAFTGR